MTLMTEEIIKQIIEEEIQAMLEEGFLQDLSSKASNILKALVFAATVGGGIGSIPSAAQAAPRPGVTATVAQSRASRVVKTLIQQANQLNLNDPRFNMPFKLDAHDPAVRDLAESISELYYIAGPERGQVVQDYIDVAIKIIKIGIKSGLGTQKTLETTKESFETRINEEEARVKKKKKKLRVVTQTTFRNNPILIQQAVLGIYMDTSQGKPIKPALKALSNALKHGVHDGDITKEQAMEVFNIIRTTKKPTDAMKKIKKIVELSK